MRLKFIITLPHLCSFPPPPFPISSMRKHLPQANNESGSSTELVRWERGRGKGVKSTAYFAEAATSATGHVASHGSPWRWRRRRRRPKASVVSCLFKINLKHLIKYQQHHRHWQGLAAVSCGTTALPAKLPSVIEEKWKQFKSDAFKELERVLGKQDVRVVIKRCWYNT